MQSFHSHLQTILYFILLIGNYDYCAETTLVSFFKSLTLSIVVFTLEPRVLFRYLSIDCLCDIFGNCNAFETVWRKRNNSVREGKREKLDRLYTYLNAMAKADEVRFVRVIHSLVAIFTLFAGAGLLAFGIWLSVTESQGLSDLQYGGENIWRYILVLPTICIIFGIFLMVTALVSLIALAKNCLGKTFRIIYVIMAAFVLIALVFICVISTFLYRNKDNEDVANFVKDAWQQTIVDDPNAICVIETEFKCRGFETYDCKNCAYGFGPGCSADVCVSCEGSEQMGYAGCYDKLVHKLASVFLPVAIVSGILAGIQLIDMLLMCCI